MYWHIDSDIISLLVILSLFIYARSVHIPVKGNNRNKKFMQCIYCGIFLAIVDIGASILAETVSSVAVLNVCYTIYYGTLILGSIAWFDYALSIFYKEEDRKRKTIYVWFLVPFFVYTALVLLNIKTGWIYYIDEKCVYHRGNMFSITLLAHAFYALVLIAFAIVKRKHIEKEYPWFVFILVPMLTSVFVVIQLLIPGWLMVIPGYMLCLLVVTMFIQNHQIHDDQQISKQYVELVEHVPCGICLYSWDGSELYPLVTNQHFSEMLGEDSYEYVKGIRGMNYTHVHPDDLEEMKRKSYIGLKETGEVDVIYRTLNNKTNEYIWVRMRGYKVQQESGQDLVYVSYYDVTQERIAEQEMWAKYELEKEKASLEDKNLLVHAIINVTTGETIQYLYKDGTEVPLANRDAFTNIKENAEQLLIDDIEKQECLRINDRDFLLKTFSRGETEIRHEYRRLLISGDVTWVRSILHLVRDPQNSNILLFEYWYDIEEEKMHDLMYQSLVEDNYEYVARIDARNHHFVVFPNKEITYHILPLTGEDFDEVGKDLYDEGIEPEDLEVVLRNCKVDKMKKNLREHGRFRYTYREVGPNRITSYKKITQYYLDEPRQIIIMTREDITELIASEADRNATLALALESAKRAGTAKSQFLSRVSHELRTPLNAIIGFMALAKDADKEQVKSYMANSDAAAKQLLAIINDVLDMSSIESGKMTIAHVPFDFKQMLQGITDMYVFQCSQKGYCFETHILTPVDEWVVGDQLRVNQILMNLLGNAVKFTDQGQIILSISQRELKNNEIFIRFEVSDTGCGMTEEMKDRLFKPFEQETASTAQKYGGNGLGLSIVGNLVNMMGGDIRVESEKGKGTTFVVEIPFARSDIIRNSQMPDKVKELRVLAVDDEENERKYVSIVLERIGVRHMCVSNGDEAMEEMEKAFSENDPFNLCIVDWRMPKMSGIEVTKRIRDKYGKNVVVIVVSAYEQYQAEEDAKIAGANMFITKPLFQSTLFDMFMTLTGGKIVKQQVSATEYDFTGKRILIAEDNAMNRMVVEGILQKSGVECVSVENGEIARDTFVKSSPGFFDAILMDIQMPVMDGYEAATAIKGSSHPSAEAIPIIALTANAFSEDIAKSLAAGMNAHVAKPIEPDELLMTLQNAFDTSKKRISN